MAIKNSTEKQWIQDLTTFTDRPPMSWTGLSGMSTTVYYSFQSSKYTPRLGQASTVKDLTNTQQNQAEEIFQLISNVTGLTFVENDNVANRILITSSTDTTVGSGSRNYRNPTNYSELIRSDIYMSESFSDFSLGTEAGKIMLHEILHALGLTHPQGLEGFAGEYENDQTVMTYNLYTPNPNLPTAPEVSSPMPYDIATLQFLYGINTEFNKGATTYTFDGNASTSIVDDMDGRSTSTLIGGFATVWDSNGNDTYKISSSVTIGSWIDLRAGTVTQNDVNMPQSRYQTGDLYSSLIGGKQYIYNAFVPNGNNGDGFIENAIGSNVSDFIFGNQLDNSLTGNAGNDLLDGGAGTDTADYSGDNTAGGTGNIEVKLDEKGNGTAIDGWGDTDTLKSIEAYIASETITGNKIILDGNFRLELGNALHIKPNGSAPVANDNFEQIWYTKPSRERALLCNLKY